MAKERKKRNKPYVPKQKNKSKWEELKHVGELTIKDISTPHMLVNQIMEEYKEQIEEDPELKNICTGLDKSYVDCIESCLKIMSQHVTSENFPTTLEDFIKDPKNYQEAKFKTGIVGKGKSKEETYNDLLQFSDLHTKYQLLAHEVYSLTHKGKVNMEMRLAANLNLTEQEKKDKEEEEKIIEETLSNLKTTIQESDKEMKEAIETLRK